MEEPTLGHFICQCPFVSSTRMQLICIWWMDSKKGGVGKEEFGIQPFVSEIPNEVQDEMISWTELIVLCLINYFQF